MFGENTEREPLSPLEILSVGERLEAMLKPAAKERQGARNDLPKHSGTVPPSPGGKVRDQVGAALGVSGKHYEQTKKAGALIRRTSAVGCGLCVVDCGLCVTISEF